MFIQLVGIKSISQDFQPPSTANGEPMELYSVEASGQYVVVRYFSTEPVSGPAVERFLTDVYCNDEGREIYRVTAKIIEPPPPKPKFLARLRAALLTLLRD
jgi:hypothetical protein